MPTEAGICLKCERDIEKRLRDGEIGQWLQPMPLSLALMLGP